MGQVGLSMIGGIRAAAHQQVGKMVKTGQGTGRETALGIAQILPAACLILSLMAPPAHAEDQTSGPETAFKLFPNRLHRVNPLLALIRSQLKNFTAVIQNVLSVCSFFCFYRVVCFDRYIVRNFKELCTVFCAQAIKEHRGKGYFIFFLKPSYGTHDITNSNLHISIHK